MKIWDSCTRLTGKRSSIKLHYIVAAQKTSLCGFTLPCVWSKKKKIILTGKMVKIRCIIISCFFSFQTVYTLTLPWSFLVLERLVNYCLINRQKIIFDN